MDVSTLYLTTLSHDVFGHICDDLSLRDTVRLFSTSGTILTTLGGPCGVGLIALEIIGRGVHKRAPIDAIVDALGAIGQALPALRPALLRALTTAHPGIGNQGRRTTDGYRKAFASLGCATFSGGSSAGIANRWRDSVISEFHGLHTTEGGTRIDDDDPVHLPIPAVPQSHWREIFETIVRRGGDLSCKAVRQLRAAHEGAAPPVSDALRLGLIRAAASPPSDGSPGYEPRNDLPWHTYQVHAIYAMPIISIYIGAWYFFGTMDWHHVKPDPTQGMCCALTDMCCRYAPLA